MAVLAKATSTELPWAQVLVLRWLVGLAGCVVLFTVRRRGPQLRRWPLLVLRGLLGSLATLFYFRAIEGLGAGPATVLNYCSPMFAALFAAAFLNERPSRTIALGLMLATLGAGFVTQGSLSTAPTLSWVALGAVLSGVLGGGALTVVKAVRNDTDSVSVFFALCVMGLLTSSPFAVPAWRPVTPEALLPALGVGLCALVAQLLLTSGLKHTTATRGAAMIQLVPPLTWVLSVGLLHEPVAATAVFGAGLCVAGVLLGTQRPPRGSG